jgi:hypothetical protein
MESPVSPEDPLPYRVFWSFRLGCLTATLLCGWALLGRLLAPHSPAETNGAIITTIEIYWLVLPASGALVGLVLPIAKHPVGAFALGFGVVLALLLAFAAHRRWGDMPWRAQVIGNTIVALLLGGGGGLQQWSVYNKRRKARLGQ